MKKSFVGYFLIFDFYIVTFLPIRNPILKNNYHIFLFLNIESI